MSTTGEPKLRALRGATTVPQDRPSQIVQATEELLRALLEQNDLTADDLVSAVFTATPDLTSEFPAVAARALGLDEVPLLCASEIPVEGGLERCIRVLLHVYTARAPKELRHLYLNEARSLRADLSQP